jgi:Domain of unknown function (DUF6456)
MREPSKPRLPKSAAVETMAGHRPARPLDHAAAKPTVNDAESPLSWLRTRRDKSGRPLISDAQYLAGERLRADFERTMLARRITSNWDFSAGGVSGNLSAELSDGAIAARQRYERAIAAVGPELSSILSRVCCMAEGIEQAERVLNLPQRSGKAILGLALTALARHYGLPRATAARRPMATWAAEDYRPSIPECEEA